MAPVSSEKKAAQKAITGRPSSARHKLSDPFPTREPKPSRGYQLLRARAGRYEPRILQAAPTSHVQSGHGGHPCSAEPKMGDLSGSLPPPCGEARPKKLLIILRINYDRACQPKIVPLPRPSLLCSIMTVSCLSASCL